MRDREERSYGREQEGRTYGRDWDNRGGHERWEERGSGAQRQWGQGREGRGYGEAGWGPSEPAAEAGRREGRESGRYGPGEEEPGARRWGSGYGEGEYGGQGGGPYGGPFQRGYGGSAAYGGPGYGYGSSGYTGGYGGGSAQGYGGSSGWGSSQSRGQGGYGGEYESAPGYAGGQYGPWAGYRQSGYYGPYESPAYASGGYASQREYEGAWGGRGSEREPRGEPFRGYASWGFGHARQEGSYDVPHREAGRYGGHPHESGWGRPRETERDQGWWSQGGWGRPEDRGRERDEESWGEKIRNFFGMGPKGYRRSDERIREDVCDRLTDDPRIDASDISITVQDGIVILEGTVDERRIRHLVEDVVDQVSGVRDVDNRLRVRRKDRSWQPGEGSQMISREGTSPASTQPGAADAGRSTIPGAPTASSSGPAGESTSGEKK